MRILSLILVALAISSSCGKNTSTSYKRDPKWILADEIYDNEIGRKIFLQLRKEKQLHVCESGWALRGKKSIQVMHCGFHYYNEIDINEARELMMSASQLYLATINENQWISSYLVVHPFKPDNIEINIFLKNINGSMLPPEKLHVIGMWDGKLHFEVGELNGEYLAIIYEETYEEALAKLNTINKQKVEFELKVKL